MVFRHLMVRLCAERDISGARIEINNGPQQERFARARWAHQCEAFSRRDLKTDGANQIGCKPFDPQRRHVSGLAQSLDLRERLGGKWTKRVIGKRVDRAHVDLA